MPLLQLNDVTKTYRQGGAFARGTEKRAVDRVSFQLEAGRCLALIGASGSGKSTLGRLVLGLERPDRGEVLYKGRPLYALRGKEAREARRNIQVVFQNSHGAVNPRYTVLDVLGEPLRNFQNLAGKSLRDQAKELLATVGLESSMLGKLPHQLSGGELQRVCIARALAPKPEIVVLDEAVSSLDMLNQSLVLDLLATIQEKSGSAYLFISHDLRVVSRIANGAALMRDGKLAAFAPDLSDEVQAAFLHGSEAMRELSDAVLSPFPPASADRAGQNTPDNLECRPRNINP